VRAAVLPPPAVRSGSIPRFGVVMTPATADRLGVPWMHSGAVLSSAGTALTRAEQDRLDEAIGAVVVEHQLYAERGFQETFTIQLLVLIVAAVLAVLIGTLTATGLALADARPDFATLAAVGARPRTRRAMAGAHALVIGLLGAVTGIATGFVPGLAVTWPLTANDGFDSARTGPVIDIPWLLLLGVGVAVPAFAALVMAATTRSRLPMVRRLGQ
jgi:putative ABC transport system permease protein